MTIQEYKVYQGLQMKMSKFGHSLDPQANSLCDEEHAVEEHLIKENNLTRDEFLCILGWKSCTTVLKVRSAYS